MYQEPVKHYSHTDLKKILAIKPMFGNGYSDGVPSIQPANFQTDPVELIEIEGNTFIKFTDYCILPLHEVAGIIKEAISFEKALRAIQEPAADQPK